MLRRLLRFATLAILPLAQDAVAIDLHRGLVEEWSVRHGGDDGTLRVEWIDSAAGEGGTTDWTALLRLEQGGTVKSDTAVLRVFDLAYLVDSGAYRPGRHGAWLKPSCLMPFQRDDLDSIHAALFKGTKPRRLYGTTHFLMINRLPQGAMAEFCSGGINTEKKVETFGGWGTTCFQSPVAECRDCRATPPFRTSPGMGVVAWRSLQRQEDWRLVRFDGRVLTHPPANLFVRPEPGETWVWTQGAGTDPPLWRITVASRLGDSAGVPGWEVEVVKRDGKGGSSRTTTNLRIDTVQGRVGLGSESAYLWAPFAPSMETRLALGFLVDWGVAAKDTVVLVDHGVSTTCWGLYYHPTTWMWKAARGIGTLWIRNEMDTYPLRTDQWSLAVHSSQPVAVSPKRSMIPTVGELRRRCTADPAFEIRRISLDGRSERGSGLVALRLLDKRGVAVLVVGEGVGKRVIRSVVP